MAGRFDHLGRSLSELYSSPCLFPHSGTGNPVPSIPPTPVHHTPVRRQAQPGDACSPYRRSSRGDGRRRRRPPQSLQMILRRLCWQMLAPPQSLQALLWRLCSQMLVPPQSLHLLLTRLCWQMLAPPQSLQLLLWRLRIYTRPPIGCLRISRPPSWSVWLCGQGVQLPAARRHDMLYLCGHILRVVRSCQQGMCDQGVQGRMFHMPHARALGGWRRGCPHGFFSFNQEEGGRVHMIMCERIGRRCEPDHATDLCL